MQIRTGFSHLFFAALVVASFGAASPALAQKKANVVMLMSDDVGWGDYGVYFGGAALGHPTPNIDRIAKEGAVFTSWYGQASCTAGRSSFMTGRIPVRTALSVVVVPGDPNGLTADTPTIAEFLKKNGYQTYFSGKWHLGDVPKFYPIEHGFDEPGSLRLQRHVAQRPSLVPDLQQGILGHVPESREPLRMGRHGRQACGQGQQRRGDYPGKPGRLRCPADGISG
jgi:hypothetical protein